MNTSPVQRLRNRRTHTLVPTTKALLQPETPHPDREFNGLTKKQQQQTKYYNRNALDLPALSEGDVVRNKPFELGDKVWKKGSVTTRLDERSYTVELQLRGETDYTWRRQRRPRVQQQLQTYHYQKARKPSTPKLIHKPVPPVPLRQPHASPQQDHSASDDLQHTWRTTVHKLQQTDSMETKTLLLQLWCRF